MSTEGMQAVHATEAGLGAVWGENLGRRYGRRTALTPVDFAWEGGVTGILGPNGAGKSTLLKILATVLPPTSGRYCIGDFMWPGHPAPIRRLTGYLPQLYGFYEYETGLEFLTYCAALKGFAPWRIARREAQELLHVVALDEAADQRIAHYSGGMRQRLGVAQSLIGDPPLLILDEPGTGLDPEERTRIRNLLRRRAGTSRIMLSTHVVSDLEQVADTIWVMAHGRLNRVGSPADLRAQAEGHVFEIAAPAARWHGFEEAWLHIANPAERPVVAAIRTGADDGLAVRVVAMNPAHLPDGAVQGVPATVEDGYLAVVHRMAGAS